MPPELMAQGFKKDHSNLTPNKSGIKRDVKNETPQTHFDNQKPYNPHEMRDMLERNNPGAKVESNTLPKRGASGAKRAGQRNPETQIVCDNKGLPNFTDHMKHENQNPAGRFFPKQGSGKNLIQLRQSHMRQATRQLREDINAGRVSRSAFTPEQLQAIKSGKEKIPKLTWRYDAGVGRMQLVDRKIHDKTGHMVSIGLNNKGEN